MINISRQTVRDALGFSQKQFDEQFRRGNLQTTTVISKVVDILCAKQEKFLGLK